MRKLSISVDYSHFILKIEYIIITDYNIFALLEFSGFQVKNCCPLFRVHVFHLVPLCDSLSHSNMWHELKNVANKVHLSPHKYCSLVHYSFQKFRALSGPAQADSQLPGFGAGTVASWALCNFPRTCSQNAKPRRVRIR